MGKLNNSICYLIGSIDRVEDAGAGWRKDITPHLKEMGVNVVNPLEKPVNTGGEKDDDRAKRKVWKEIGDWESLSKSMKLVRTVDLRFVDKADFIIGKINTNEHCCGSYEELFLANRQKKPILLFSDNDKASFPDWLFGTIPHNYLFNNLSDLLNYLSDINRLPPIMDVVGRWVFLDPNRM